MYPQFIFRKRGMQVYPKIIAVRIAPRRAVSLTKYLQIRDRLVTS